MPALHFRDSPGFALTKRTVPASLGTPHTEAPRTIATSHSEPAVPFKTPLRRSQTFYDQPCLPYSDVPTLARQQLALTRKNWTCLPYHSVQESTGTGHNGHLLAVPALTSRALTEQSGPQLTTPALPSHAGLRKSMDQTRLAKPASTQQSTLSHSWTILPS